MAVDYTPPAVYFEYSDHAKNSWISGDLWFFEESYLQHYPTRARWDEKKVFVPWKEIEASFAFRPRPVGNRVAHEFTYKLERGKFGTTGSYFSNPYDRDSKDRDAWSFGATYRGAKLGKSGSYGFYLGFTDIGVNAYNPNSFSFAGMHGFEFGASYAFNESIIGSFKAFKGADSASDEKVHAGAVELTIYF